MPSDEARLYIVDKVRADLVLDKRFTAKAIRSWVFRTRKAAKEFCDAKHKRAKKPLSFLYILRPAVWGPDNVG